MFHKFFCYWNMKLLSMIKGEHWNICRLTKFENIIGILIGICRRNYCGFWVAPKIILTENKVRHGRRQSSGVFYCNLEKKYEIMVWSIIFQTRSCAIKFNLIYTARALARSSKKVRSHSCSSKKPRSRSPFWKIFRRRSWLKSAAHFLRSTKVTDLENGHAPARTRQLWASANTALIY